MREIGLKPISGCVTTFCCTLVCAAARADVKTEIQAQYTLLNQAAARKDVEKVMALHTPDYVHITVKGARMPAAELRKSAAYLFKVASNIRGSNTIRKMTMNGTSAVVTVKNHVEARMTNPYDTTQTAAMISDSVTEDTWVRSKSGWLLKVSKDITRKATIGGLPLPDK